MINYINTTVLTVNYSLIVSAKIKANINVQIKIKIHGILFFRMYL